MVESSEQEQALERRAEELAKEKYSDINLFMEWIKEEFSCTDKAVMVHKMIVANRTDLNNVYAKGAGLMLCDMWWQNCLGAGEEQARSELE